LFVVILFVDSMNVVIKFRMQNYYILLMPTGHFLMENTYCKVEKNNLPHIS